MHAYMIVAHNQFDLYGNLILALGCFNTAEFKNAISLGKGLVKKLLKK